MGHGRTAFASPKRSFGLAKAGARTSSWIRWSSWGSWRPWCRRPGRTCSGITASWRRMPGGAVPWFPWKRCLRSSAMASHARGDPGGRPDPNRAPRPGVRGEGFALNQIRCRSHAGVSGCAGRTSSSGRWACLIPRRGCRPPGRRRRRTLPFNLENGGFPVTISPRRESYIIERGQEAAEQQTLTGEMNETDAFRNHRAAGGTADHVEWNRVSRGGGDYSERYESREIKPSAGAIFLLDDTRTPLAGDIVVEAPDGRRERNHRRNRRHLHP